MAILTLMFGRDVLGTYEMDRDVVLIGRATDCDIIVDNLNVSRHHAKLEKRDGLYYIEDLKSNNGTYLNGNRVTSDTVTFGDEIGVGKHTLRFDSHSRLGRLSNEVQAPGARQHAMDMDDSGTVFVKADDMAAIQQKMSAARRAHLRIAGVPGSRGTMELGEGELKIGRGAHCEIRIPGFLVGGTHCLIGCRAEGYRIEQVGGFRALRVNGERTRSRALADGDVIEIARARITFHDAKDN